MDGYKKDGATVKIWASGKVVRIADGVNTKRTEKCTKLLPAGALLWAWDADPEFNEAAGEQWMILHPDKWNRHVQYAWRFDPCELGVRNARKRATREPIVDECETDDEFYE